MVLKIIFFHYAMLIGPNMPELCENSNSVIRLNSFTQDCVVWCSCIIIKRLIITFCYYACFHFVSLSLCHTPPIVWVLKVCLKERKVGKVADPEMKLRSTKDNAAQIFPTWNYKHQPVLRQHLSPFSWNLAQLNAVNHTDP